MFGLISSLSAIAISSQKLAAQELTVQHATFHFFLSFTSYILLLTFYISLLTPTSTSQFVSTTPI